eukprot:COSAG02_NODE_26347_length_635_cov_0.757463_1_plen_30_part_10
MPEGARADHLGRPSGAPAALVATCSSMVAV